MTETKPICEAQAGGMMCGRPVAKWGYQCEYHDPWGSTRTPYRLFDPEVIEGAIVSRWKYWILPLINPRRYRQVKWSFTDDDGRTHKFKGLLEDKK